MAALFQVGASRGSHPSSACAKKWRQWSSMNSPASAVSQQVYGVKSMESLGQSNHSEQHKQISHFSLDKALRDTTMRPAL